MAAATVAAMSVGSQSAVSAQPAQPAQPTQPTSANSADPVVSGLIVEEVSPTRMLDEHAIDLLVDGDVDISAGLGGGFARLELGTSMSVGEAEAVAAQLVASGAVRSAEPDLPRFIDADPLFGSQWSLAPASGADAGAISVEEAWGLTTGSSDVVIAVIDTGSLPHPDLTSRLVAGYDMISSTFTANDGDGRDGNPLDEGDSCNATPSSWHGIHVAGIAGADTSNSFGISGVDQRARIQPIRILGVCGGVLSDEISAIRWAAGLPVAATPINPTPADVINLSLGGFGACGAAEQSAIDDAVAAGAVVVVAAGNSNLDLDQFEVSPAKCRNVISVAATDRNGERAAYSNHGSFVDLAAPGGSSGIDGGIVSLSNAGTTTPDLGPAGWTYSSKQGTSMAAPHVSGVVALMLAANSSLSPAQVEQILKQTARPFPISPRGAQFTCSSDPAALYHCGAGMLDAGAAVRAADALVTAPSPPVALSVATGSGAARVTWSEPADGGSPVTSYTVTMSPGGRTCTWSSGPLTCTIDGLDAGRQYMVSAVAQNRRGVSQPAVSAPFTWWPTYNPVPAARLFDTRSGPTGGLVGVAAGRVTPGSPLSARLTGIGGVPSSGVGSLSLNVTVVGASQPGFVTVFDCSGAVPDVSSVNFGIGEAVANAVTITPGIDGRVCFDTSIPVHVIADVNGWFAAGQGFQPITAARLFDTRSGSDVVRAGRVIPGTPLSVGLLGVGGVPSSGVGGLSLNVTVVGASEAGFVTVFACGGAVPGVSSVNFGVGEAVANAVIVAPAVDGRVCFDASTRVQVIADINGWFAQGQGFEPVPAVRLFDTRTGPNGGQVGVAAGRVVPGSPLSVGMSGVGGVPSTGVGGLSLNVTVVGASEAGFLTVFACGGAVPGVSSVNFGPGEAVANAVIVPLGADGRVCFDTSTPVQVIADVNGWFTSDE
jgi:serine protease